MGLQRALVVIHFIPFPCILLIKSTKLVAFLRPRKSREANEIQMHFEVGGISCCISQIALAPLGLYGVVYRRLHAQLGATPTKGARLQTTCY